MTKHVLLLVCLLFGVTLHAQENVAAHTEIAKHNIKRATTLALLPGAGQAYNRKYWKIPLVWGAIGGSAYYYSDLNSDFKSYKEVLTYIIDHPDLTTRVELEFSAPNLFDAVPNPFFQSSSDGVAQEAIGFMEALRTQREYAFFGIIGIYVLSILDANIDAHLYDFDVSDDLSISPKIRTYHGPSINQGASPGFSLTYTFP
jgi:hypothetical protein|tara:strand:- start:1383 stop:1985 length:603 start_codon:yes stop_codon:yes gene_type:complete